MNVPYELFKNHFHLSVTTSTFGHFISILFNNILFCFSDSWLYGITLMCSYMGDIVIRLDWGHSTNEIRFSNIILDESNSVCHLVNIFICAISTKVTVNALKTWLDLLPSSRFMLFLKRFTRYNALPVLFYWWKLFQVRTLTRTVQIIDMKTHLTNTSTVFQYYFEILLRCNFQNIFQQFADNLQE